MLSCYTLPTFLELPSLYFGFLLHNFAVHLEIYAPYLCFQCIFPSTYLKMRGKNWFGSLILVEIVELVFMSRYTTKS